MHITEVVTKDGKEFSGPLWCWKPAENWFSIICGDESRKFSFDEVESVVTKEERVSKGVIKDDDEIDRARRYLAEGRKYGWDVPSEKFAWE